MDMTRDNATIMILLIGEASGVFAGFCPSWFTVASPFFHDQEARAGNIKRIRAGELAAASIVIATGAAVSSRTTDSNFAFYASVAITAIFVAGYEYQIAHPSKQDGTGPDPIDATTRVMPHSTWRGDYTGA
jgi:hypothetical protein